MSKVLIIAEAGVNHNGDLSIAKKLVKAAAISGADFIKFQTFQTELSIAQFAPKANYQIINTNNIESQFDMVKRLELSKSDFHDLMLECRKHGIGFLSTGFDLPSLDFLDSAGIPFFKIPSGEITNKPYLEHTARKGKPIIISTGMAKLKEIEDALFIMYKNGVKREDLTVLHCNTEYPTPMNDVNLKAMNQIRDVFEVNVGYSDHTLGIEVPIAAVALGACVVEKHFTLNRNMEGPDHAASLEPDELKNMVTAIRNVELAISGNGLKEPSPSELKNISIARKSIHIKNNMGRGSRISKDDLIMLRPGDGISPMEIDIIVGKKLNQNLSKGTKLSWSQLEN